MKPILLLNHLVCLFFYPRQFFASIFSELSGKNLYCYPYVSFKNCNSSKIQVNPFFQLETFFFQLTKNSNWRRNIQLVKNKYSCLLTLQFIYNYLPNLCLSSFTSGKLWPVDCFVLELNTLKASSNGKKPAKSCSYFNIINHKCVKWISPEVCILKFK